MGAQTRGQTDGTKRGPLATQEEESRIEGWQGAAGSNIRRKKYREQERGTRRGGGTEESDRRGRDGVAAEGRNGGRGGGGRGRAKTQRGRHGGQNKEGAKRSNAKPWGKKSAEEYPGG